MPHKILAHGNLDSQATLFNNKQEDFHPPRGEIRSAPIRDYVELITFVAKPREISNFNLQKPNEIRTEFE